MQKSNIKVLESPLPSHDSPWVSVIILNYNGQKYLRQCVESVQGSDYPFFEVIVVDNASKDSSMDIFEPHSQRIATIINPKNYMFPKGCNQGIKVARGEIIVILDLDVKVRPTWLRELIKPFVNDPKVVVAGSKLLYEDEVHIQHAGGYIYGNAISRHYGYSEEDRGQWNEVREVDYVTGASIAIRKSFLDRVGGGLDEMFSFYYDDNDICWHAHRLGYKVLYVPSSVAVHYESSSIVKFSYRFIFNYTRGRWRFLLKNYPWEKLLTKNIIEEWKWFWKDGCRNGEWLPVIHAYMTIPFSIPQAIHRRILRKFSTQTGLNVKNVLDY
jgi:GT2 family glycosyltransferase